jgi:tRNA dimethylallyltransferase
LFIEKFNKAKLANIVQVDDTLIYYLCQILIFFTLFLTDSKKYLIVLVGPTAIGKTALSIQLAKHYQTSIFSADSRQFFQEMQIGTAKPTDEEMQEIPHYFIGHKSIHDEYNAGQFEQDALQQLEEHFNKNKVAILVGGSGLYVNTVCFGIDDIPKDLSIRATLQQQLENEGLESLQTELKLLDPEHYATCNIKNPQRIIRALEVCKVTGKPYSSLRLNQNKHRPFTPIFIGLDAPRDIVYSRINARVDLMIQQGLVEEVRQLLPYRNLNALNTVGYKEIFNHFDNLCSLDEAIEKIKQNTRNFAKRQLTWFKKNIATLWIDAFDKPLDQAILHIDEQLRSTK